MNHKTKVIALYLPQFHQVPENDEWWGKGFTDWVSARNAKPLFPGHYQPRIPAQNNFYNLLDKSTMEWQAKLARKSGIYGFCIYHYWFGEKQLLEKPAENLLKWKDINIHYCFSWANESWIASWSKLKGNAWTDNTTSEKKDRKGLLLEQKYGGEPEWERHFQYLLPFFQDRRYIKKDGKPVFVLYRQDDIPHIKDMILYWNKLAKENGLKGIYFIGTNSKRGKSKHLDAAFRYEPLYTQCNGRFRDSSSAVLGECIRESLEKRGIELPQFISYDKVWKELLERDNEKDVYRGAFTDFDSSPRKGKNSVIFRGSNPEKFYKYFDKLYQKCLKNQDDFLFITAWNEWGEGAYLEPDNKFGTGYLKAINKVVRKNKEN